ncbi:MAG: hypothetical protein ACLP0H_03820 [Terriglobales bacterium]
MRKPRALWSAFSRRLILTYCSLILMLMPMLAPMLGLLLALSLVPAPAIAADAMPIVGDWEGTLDPGAKLTPRRRTRGPCGSGLRPPTYNLFEL